MLGINERGASMSLWRELNIYQKVIEILSEIRYYDPTHHFGIPFVTAYQLAILLADQYPEIKRRLGMEIGGEGIGERNSLAQYLAKELSSRINSGEITDIEGAFLSNRMLRDIFFTYGNDDIKSSLTSSGYDLSMYRLRRT